MHHAVTVIGFGIVWVIAFVIAAYGLYYRTQAINNLKPDSSWSGKLSFRIPRSEFTERGLFYRRRGFIVQFIFAAWGFVMMAVIAWLFHSSGN
jgi:hypothetical protein